MDTRTKKEEKRKERKRKTKYRCQDKQTSGDSIKHVIANFEI